MHISDHLHVVIKEHAHKRNPYFDPISISDLTKESIAQALKVHAAVEVQQLLALVALLLLLAT